MRDLQAELLLLLRRLVRALSCTPSSGQLVSSRIRLSLAVSLPNTNLSLCVSTCVSLSVCVCVDCLVLQSVRHVEECVPAPPLQPVQVPRLSTRTLRTHPPTLAQHSTTQHTHHEQDHPHPYAFRSAFACVSS